MVTFEDKDVVKDPLDELQFVSIPNNAREGPIVDFLNAKYRKDDEESYHQSNPKAGHWSTASGCSRRTYLNYIHKLDDDLEPIPTTPESIRTFTHGDIIHEWIQGDFRETLGNEHVTIEENIEGPLTDEFKSYGHADIVIRDFNSRDVVEEKLPEYVDFLPNSFKGFPDPFVIDIKTTAEFLYYSYGDDGHARSIPKRSNLMQLMGYMHYLDAEYGALLYFSKRNDHMEEYWVEFNEDLFQQGKRNIVNVLEHVNAGEPAPKDAESYMCDPEYCPYMREGHCTGVEDVKPSHDNEEQEDQFRYESPEWV